MHNATQPVLCCLGKSVAGNPTQFVLERMLAAAQLDWRVFTVEVKESEVEDALRGLAAMNIDGFKVIQDYDGELASDFLIKATAGQALTADAAKLERGQWTIWNSQSEGWLWWHDRFHPTVTQQASQAESPGTRLLLIGDCFLSRGIFDSITRSRPAFKALEGNRYCEVVWVAGPASLQSDASESRLSDSDNELTVLPFESLAAFGEHRQTLDGADSKGTQPLNHCVFGLGIEDLKEFSNLQQRFPLEIKTFCASHEAVAEAGKSELKVDLQISPSELTAAALASDFKRWTGEEPDFDLMLEAIEEFSGF